MIRLGVNWHREKRFSHFSQKRFVFSAPKLFFIGIRNGIKLDAISFPLAEISAESLDEGNDCPVEPTFFPERIRALGEGKGGGGSSVGSAGQKYRNQERTRAGRSYFLGEEVTVPLSRLALMFTRRNFGRVSTFKCRLR